MVRSPEDVLTYWFGQLDENGRADDAHRLRWWVAARHSTRRSETASRPRTDSSSTTAPRAGRRRRAAGSPRSSCSINSPETCSAARPRCTPPTPSPSGWSVTGSQPVTTPGSRRTERCFFYMPLMHSESLEDQDQCLEMFERLEHECPAPAREGIAGNRGYAVRHRDIVRDWGRFPHRNAILGRESTPEELEFIKDPKNRFGG